MASNHAEPGLLERTSASSELGDQWRRLTRVATAMAFVTSPAVFVWLHTTQDWSVGWSLVATFLTVIAFRGLVDLLVRRLLPWPSLYGTDDAELREEDVVNRRRASFWRFWFRLVFFVLALLTVTWFIRVLVPGGSTSWVEHVTGLTDRLSSLNDPQIWATLIIFPVFFLFNFLILFGPLMLVGITQMRGFEPGDADWGVRLDDVRGQDEAKREVSRVVSLWQSGEAFEEAGGKRERGLLFLGAPGTGKTMLAKAIATGFNSPIVFMPGSGFQQTFMGMDAVIVRWLARKAKKLARKWGGQCIVFIDEIDAVGMRRSALGGAGAAGAFSGTRIEDFLFFGPQGALNPSEDVIIETKAWRERLFAEREGRPTPNGLARLATIVNQGAFPGMMGGGMGQLALNQLLVVMDGIDNPPFFRRLYTNWINTFLDATYVIPRRAGRIPLRIPRPRPRKDQIYFIGATNVPLNVLDPALTRPGRMGRHVWLRTPTKEDRKDIFDLYIDKVAHEPDLDTPKRRDELARITAGYSPAMIEQVCSMALTYAHSDGREVFDYRDIFEAMTTVESGTAVNIEYPPEETKAVAIHEAGHAAASHVYAKDTESTRLSVRMRGASLGHHQSAEQQERFHRWRSDEMATLIHILGAMAAERVFYGQTSIGVGGDVQSATALSAIMVGAAAMGPEPLDLDASLDSREEERVLDRFEQIGLQIMNRTGGGGPLAHDPVAGVLSDPNKRKTAAQILGQAYVTAHNLMKHNRKGIEHIADEVVARREIYGDELLDLLNEAKLKRPAIELTEEDSWPML